MNRKLPFLFLLPLFALAQPEDSLVEKYYRLKNTLPANNACADSLFLCLYFLHLDNVSLADSVGEDFLQYANAQNNDYLKAKANLIKAVIRNEQGKNIEAISYAIIAIKYFRNQPSKEVCFTYQLLSVAYNAAGNYKLARESNKKALAMAEALQNDVLINNSYSNIGASYNHDKQYKEAIPWFHKVVALNEKMIAQGKKQKSLLISGYDNLGLCYRELGQYDSALFYSRKALAFAEQQNSQRNVAYVLSDIGATFLLKKEYDTAIAYLQKSAQMREEQKEGFELAYTYMFLGDSYSGKNEQQNALNYYRKAIALNAQNNNLKQRYEIYHQLGEMFYRFKEFDSAYVYNKAHSDLRDSVLRAKSELSTAATIASYELDEKEKNIQLLNAQSKQQQLLLALTAIGILTLLLIIVLVVRTRNQREKTLYLEAQLRETLAIENLRKEKERISRDLHDNVGAQLSYLITNLDWISQHPEAVQDKTEFYSRLHSLSESGRNAMLTLRETIWAVSHKELSAEDFADRFKQYVLKMTEFNRELKIEFKEHIGGNVLLSPVNALNTFRICQEAFHNALRHSQSTHIIIEFKTEENDLCFVITDNGIGFDANSEKAGHYGLQNMKSRAEEAGGVLTIESAPAKGTRLELKLKNR